MWRRPANARVVLAHVPDRDATFSNPHRPARPVRRLPISCERAIVRAIFFIFLRSAMISSGIVLSGSKGQAMEQLPRLRTLRLRGLLVVVLLSSGCGLAILATALPACGGPPAPSPLRLSPVGLPVAGNQLHCDAGLTVMDWNRDGLPDLLFHDTGSTGSVTICLNDGTLAEPRYGRGIWLPYNSTETTPTT